MTMSELSIQKGDHLWFYIEFNLFPPEQRDLFISANSPFFTKAVKDLPWAWGGRQAPGLARGDLPVDSLDNLV